MRRGFPYGLRLLDLRGRSPSARRAPTSLQLRLAAGPRGPAGGHLARAFDEAGGAAWRHRLDESFAKAVEQLGNEKLEVGLGGIHA